MVFEVATIECCPSSAGYLVNLGGISSDTPSRLPFGSLVGSPDTYEWLGLWSREEVANGVVATFSRVELFLKEGPFKGCGFGTFGGVLGDVVVVCK